MYKRLEETTLPAPADKDNNGVAQPVITVLIDTYNYGRFIEEAIGSVLSQDFPMDLVQVLVVDDGSTDDTSERVRKYGSKVEYFYKPNGGQASALNEGFARARGDIVLLLDADDYFLPGKLRTVAEQFQKHPEAGLIYHALRDLHTDTGKTREPGFVSVSVFLPDDVRKLVTFCAYPTSCLAFRRKVAEQVLPIPESLRLQADGYIELLAGLLAPVIAIPEVLSVYRIHGGNLYYACDDTGTAEKKQRLARSHQNLIKELRAWTGVHRSALKGVRADLLLSSQFLRLQEHSFVIEPPGRVRFFWFLLRQNYTHRSLQTWRLMLLNCVAAFASLGFGYRKRKTVQAWQARMIETMQSLIGGRGAL
jgi:glycosyltransferase involved in cell wall biosynthesis